MIFCLILVSSLLYSISRPHQKCKHAKFKPKAPTVSSGRCSLGTSAADCDCVVVLRLLRGAQRHHRVCSLLPARQQLRQLQLRDGKPLLVSGVARAHVSPHPLSRLDFMHFSLQFWCQSARERRQWQQWNRTSDNAP